MKIISKSLIILSLCLFGLVAHAQENQPGTAPEAGSHDDTDVKGSIAKPTKSRGGLPKWARMFSCLWIRSRGWPERSTNGLATVELRCLVV